MMGHNIRFKGVIWKIIPKLTLYPFLYNKCINVSKCLEKLWYILSDFFPEQLFLKENIWCDPSIESSQRDSSIDGSQHMQN